MLPRPRARLLAPRALPDQRAEQPDLAGQAGHLPRLPGDADPAPAARPHPRRSALARAACSPEPSSPQDQELDRLATSELLGIRRVTRAGSPRGTRRRRGKGERPKNSSLGLVGVGEAGAEHPRQHRHPPRGRRQPRDQRHRARGPTSPSTTATRRKTLLVRVAPVRHDVHREVRDHAERRRPRRDRGSASADERAAEDVVGDQHVPRGYEGGGAHRGLVRWTGDGGAGGRVRPRHDADRHRRGLRRHPGRARRPSWGSSSRPPR